MKKILALSLTLIFFVWILPLGAFIKPSKQKIACGGKRAIHQCMLAGKSNQLAPQDTNNGPGVKLTTAQGQVDKPVSSGGNGNDLLSFITTQSSDEQAFPRQRPDFLLKRFLLIPVIDHVPKP